MHEDEELRSVAQLKLRKAWKIGCSYLLNVTLYTLHHSYIHLSVKSCDIVEKASGLCIIVKICREDFWKEFIRPHLPLQGIMMPLLPSWLDFKRRWTWSKLSVCSSTMDAGKIPMWTKLCSRMSSHKSCPTISEVIWFEVGCQPSLNPSLDFSMYKV